MSNTVMVEEAVTNAGFACKKSKDAGSAKAMLFTDSLMEEYRKRLRYISELDVAIRTGQMQVYIQPKTAADGVRVVGGEALIRWIKPDNQIVFPGDFIPIFEKSGDIITLDYFVYKEIFKYQRNRLDNHLPVVPISVNVSKLHLKNDNLKKYLERLFNDYKLPVDLIELELTENVYIENMDQAMRLLNWCKEKKIKIAMDDFGSGYSSLNMLDQVSVDIMKIDKTFLKNEVLQKNECIILEHVVSMADKMDIITVCEGVESKEQLEFLADIGCNVIQGYYVGRPMPMKDFDVYLEKHLVEEM
jgi:EAL domain-containing protein (putative c-di-GMP-specific phosphodiesterase class I)